MPKAPLPISDAQRFLRQVPEIQKHVEDLANLVELLVNETAQIKSQIAALKERVHNLELRTSKINKEVQTSSLPPIGSRPS